MMYIVKEKEKKGGKEKEPMGRDTIAF